MIGLFAHEVTFYFSESNLLGIARVENNIHAAYLLVSYYIHYYIKYTAVNIYFLYKLHIFFENKVVTLFSLFYLNIDKTLE